MIIQRTPTKIDKVVSLQIGQHLENAATQIKFDVSDWITAHPNASFHILFKRPGEVQAQPVLSSLEEDILAWTVQAWETALTGVGYAEVRAMDDDTALVAKSRVIPCSVESSVVDDGETPTYSTWVTEVIAAKDTAVAAKNEAVAVETYIEGIVDGTVEAVEEAGATQIAAVQSEGSTQVGAVQSEGSTQVGAVQAKGTEVLDSIPTDYSDLSAEVSTLESALDATNNRISYNLVRPIVISTNLFDKDSANIGLYILSNGTISSASDWFASAPIFTEGITNIFKSNGHLTFWTKDGTYISGIGLGTNTTTVPQNAEYAILSASVSVLNTAMVNEGTVAKPYDNYKAAISQADIYRLSDTFDKYLLLRDAIIPDVHSSQLFDKTAITTGYYINANGEFVAASGWFYSDKIFDEITPGETYTKSGTCTAYDSDDNFIQQFANSVTTFVMPANTDYVRMSRGETALDITYLVKGTVVTADLQYYKRYGKNQIDIPQTYIVDINGNGDYTSLTKCVKEHRFEECDIIIRAGTYDLYQEFSDEYGTEFTSGSTVYEGIQVDKHRRFFLDSDAIIKFEYTGSVENIIKYFSPFKFDGIGGEIHGGKIVASNCRYAIHSDVYAYASGKETSIIDGVYVEFNNPARNVIIGGGMGQSSDITVQNCVLKQTADGTPTAIFYHNAETGQAQGRIRITNNYCDNGRIYVQSFGESTKITTALVSGNRCTSVSKVSNSPDNMELLAFNNMTDN